MQARMTKAGSYVWGNITWVGSLLVNSTVGRVVTEKGSAVLKAVQYYLIGDLRKMDRVLLNGGRDAFLDPSKTNQTSLGLIGTFVIYVPPSKKQLNEVLAIADSKPNSRYFYQNFSLFAGGPVLLSESGTHALHQHKELAFLLSDSKKITDIIKRLCREMFSMDGKQEITERRISALVKIFLAELLLDITHLSVEDIHIIDTYLNQSIHNSPVFKAVLKIPFFNQKAKQDIINFKELAAKLMNQVSSIILHDLDTVIYHDSKPKNFITAVILGIIKKENPELTQEEVKVLVAGMSLARKKQYFHHPETLAAFAVLGAGESLTKLIMRGIEMLSTSRDCHGQSYFQHALYDDLTTSSASPMLETFRKEALRSADTGLRTIGRYLDKGFEVPADSKEMSAVKIPSRSYLFIDFGWNNAMMKNASGYLSKPGMWRKVDQDDVKDVPFTPFSSGERICPAMMASKIAFNEVIRHAVIYYDITEKTGAKNSYVLTPRETLNATSNRRAVFS